MNETKIIYNENDDFRNTLSQFWYDNKFCDLNLKTADGIIFPVHKIILSSYSEYFREKLLDPETYCIYDNVIILDEIVTSNILKLVLEFVYTGQVNVVDVPCEDILSLYEAAILFKISELKSGIEFSLINQTNMTNCLQLWRAGVEYFNEKLRDEFENFIKENCTDFLEKYIHELSASEIITILRFRTLNCSQENLYLYAIKWIKLNFKERRKYVKYIFENIHFVNLPIKLFIKDNNIDEDLLQQNRLLNKMIVKEIFSKNTDNKSSHHDHKSHQNSHHNDNYNKKAAENHKIKSESRSEPALEICIGNEDSKLSLTKCKSDIKIDYDEVSLLTSNGGKNGNKKQNQEYNYDTELLPYYFTMDRNKSRLLITEHNFNELDIKNKLIFKLFNYKKNKWFSTVYLDDNNITVFIGGLNTSKCEYFQTGYFHELPKLKQCRWKHSSIIHNGKIYCCGGQNNKTMEIFDLNKLQWIDGPPLLHQRWSFGLVEKDALFYAIGGYSESTNWASDNYVELYDPRVKLWQRMNGPSRVNSGLLKAINFNNKIIAFKWDRFNQYKTLNNCFECGLSYYYPMNYECFYFEPFEFEDDIYVFGESEDCTAKLFKFNSISKEFEDFVNFSKSYGHDLHIY